MGEIAISHTHTRKKNSDSILDFTETLKKKNASQRGSLNQKVEPKEYDFLLGY